VLWATLALTAVALALMPGLRFDSDPLNLRDPLSESVVSVRALMDDGDASFRAIYTTAADRDHAGALATRLEELPSVARVVSAASLVPDDQDAKLWQLEDLRFLLGDELLSRRWAITPSKPDELRRTAAGLAAALEARAAHAALAARLRGLDAALTAASPAQGSALAAGVDAALLGELPGLLEQLGDGLAADAPVGLEDLPTALRQQWIDAQGHWLLRIEPAVDVHDFEALDAFVDEVRTVTPAVAGGTVKQIEAGHAISTAFFQAMLLAILAIAALLLVLLRDPALTLRVLLPLVLGGCLTTATLVLLDLPLNYANIIALPLLLGVAVDNGIHLVWRQRAGQLPHGNVLRTATASAIVFSGLTSAASFANLGLSPHAGTASMGILLAVGLGFMLVCTLVVLPALLPTGSDTPDAR
jgi:hypothetical protein